MYTWYDYGTDLSSIHEMEMAKKREDDLMNKKPEFSNFLLDLGM